MVRLLTPILLSLAFSEGISMNLGTDIHHVSGHCRTGFQGQMSKIKVMIRPNAIMVEAWCGVVTDLFVDIQLS